MKKHVGRARFVVAWLVGGTALAAAFAACGKSSATTRALLAEGCALDSDCDEPLVCVFGSCHVACAKSLDCPDGSRCVSGPRPSNVCESIAQSTCVRNSDCPGVEVCAVDGHCRDACVTERDCLPNQTCVHTSCADLSELVDGSLAAATDADLGPTACVYDSDCPGALLCLAGTCTVQCVTAKDCRGAPCVDGGCVVDGGAPADGADDASDADGANDANRADAASDAAGADAGDAADGDAGDA
jgi:hypothetical protein